MIWCRSHAAPRRAALSGFSLVELLVVVAIIGILAALMPAALSRVRQMADDTKCQANLRQLGAGYLAYSADHDGNLLASKYWFYPSNGTYPNQGCLDYFGIALPPGANPEMLPGTILTCPAMKRKFPHMFRCYSLNVQALQYYPDPGTPMLPGKLTRIVHPDAMFMFTDGVTDGSVTPQGSSSVTYAYTAFGSGVSPSLFRAPHHGLQNVVYFDGHVDAVPVSTFAQNSTTDFFGSK